MHNFSMLLTQKCLSMGLIDKSYSEWLSKTRDDFINLVRAMFGWLFRLRLEANPILFDIFSLNSEIHKWLSCCHL